MKLFFLFAWVIPTVVLLVGVIAGVANLKIGFLSGLILGGVAYLANSVVAPEVLEGVWLTISQLWSLTGLVILLPWVITASALVTGNWTPAAKAAQTAKAAYSNLSAEDKEVVKKAATAAAKVAARAATAYAKQKGFINL